MINNLFISTAKEYLLVNILISVVPESRNPQYTPILYALNIQSPSPYCSRLRSEACDRFVLVSIEVCAFRSHALFHAFIADYHMQVVFPDAVNLQIFDGQSFFVEA